MKIIVKTQNQEAALLKNKMIEVAENFTSLDFLYESQVDSELFTEETDWERDSVAFFYNKNEDNFCFEKEISSHNGLIDNFLQFNKQYVFIAFVDANTALSSRIKDLLND